MTKLKKPGERQIELKLSDKHCPNKPTLRAECTRGKREALLHRSASSLLRKRASQLRRIGRMVAVDNGRAGLLLQSRPGLILQAAATEALRRLLKSYLRGARFRSKDMKRLLLEASASVILDSLDAAGRSIIRKSQK